MTADLWLVPLALILDLLIGDPRWPLHPARLLGRLALSLESPMRRFPNEQLAGTLTALLVILTGSVGAWCLVTLASVHHPLFGYVVALLLIYTTLAAGDMIVHARRVARPLRAGNLPDARHHLSMIVGRDTDRLDEAGITRATLESIAESTIDGVTAPIVYATLGAILGGPALAAGLAMLYRASNTLDSTFGYTTDRYLRFGWASARFDDLLNLVPARLTIPCMIAGTWVLGLRGGAALRCMWRDGQKHNSPNSGLPEATLAGALGVQLGGVCYYDGDAEDHPLLGDDLRPACAEDIGRANRLLVITSCLLALGLAGMGAYLLEK